MNFFFELSKSTTHFKKLIFKAHYGPFLFRSFPLSFIPVSVQSRWHHVFGYNPSNLVEQGCYFPSSLDGTKLGLRFHFPFNCFLSPFFAQYLPFHEGYLIRLNQYDSIHSLSSLPRPSFHRKRRPSLELFGFCVVVLMSNLTMPYFDLSTTFLLYSGRCVRLFLSNHGCY